MSSSLSIARAANGESRPCAASSGPAPRAPEPGAAAGDALVADGASLIVRLYRAEMPGLVQSFRRRASHADEALDLIHDAFVRLLGLGADRLQALEQEQPAAYLNRTTRNLAHDRARTDVRRSAAHHVALDDIALAAPDFERQLQARDDLRRLEAAVLRMKPRTRAVYLAHRIEGLSYAEIAQRCGLSVKGVEKQMSRAISAVDCALDRD